MMLIHGDNTTLSLTKLISLKSDYIGEVLTFEAKDLTPVLLRENLMSQSLFSDKKLVIVENPSGNKKLFDEIEVPSDSDLIIFSDKKLTSSEVLSLQKKLPTLKVEEFKIDPVVFKFLESLAPKNQKVMIPLWHDYIKFEEPEVALVMLARQIRLLLGDGDFKKLAPWQQQRIVFQAKKFSTEKLTELHGKLLEADFKNKTGETPLDLAASLELILLTL